MREKDSVFENFFLIVVSRLNVYNNQLTILPESVGNLSHLKQ